MIGTRAAVAAAVVAAAVVLLLGAGGAGPATTLEARRLVVDRAAAADEALAALEASIQPGVDAARRGTALVVAGADPPGAELTAAGESLEGAVPVATHAAAAMEALDGAVLAAGLDATIPDPVSPDELGSIAAQLGSTAPAADAFATMRRRAEGLVGLLDESLVALEAGSLAEAGERVADARADHEVIAAWEVDLVTLPVWLVTTDAMIGAMEAIVAAADAGDEAAALAAAEDFAGLSEEAATADRALRIALGEGGTAIAAAPLGRLATLLRDVADARAAVASTLEKVER
jgi:hypothetical protein